MRRLACLVIVASLWIAVGAAQAPSGSQTGTPGSAQQGEQWSAPVFVSGTVWGKLRTALDPIMGWPVGVSLESLPEEVLAEALRKAAAMGVVTVEGSSAQQVGLQVRKPFDYRLTPDEQQGVRSQLKVARLQMPAYVTSTIGEDEPTSRKVFEFAKGLNARMLVVERIPEALTRVEALANEYEINVAFSGQPQAIAAALRGRGQRLGAYADIGLWMEQGVRPVDGLAQVKERLFAVKLSDRNALGNNGRRVRLGSGAADVTQLLEEIRRSSLTPFIVVEGAGGANAAADLTRALDDFEAVVQPVAARRVAELSRTIPIKGPDRLTPEEREKISLALPERPAATPKQRRRLLVFDANIGYGGNVGGHRSIPAANMLIEEFGKKTGAYEAVFSNDLENFKYDKLRQFDAVLMNNTVGMIFVDPELRESLARFVREGGGLAGYHGTSHVSMDWPEFREILGAVEGAHKTANEIATVRIDDPASPLTAAFKGQSFVHQDEFYRFNDMLTRNNVRVLMSIDVEKTDMNQAGSCSRCTRPDNDYILSWVRSHGKGRVFYTALGHAPAFFAVREINEFFLAGIQFALGDLDADTTPSARSAPAGR